MSKLYRVGFYCDCESDNGTQYTIDKDDVFYNYDSINEALEVFKAECENNNTVVACGFDIIDIETIQN